MDNRNCHCDEAFCERGGERVRNFEPDAEFVEYDGKRMPIMRHDCFYVVSINGRLSKRERS